jgi:hypothetical protein
MEMKKEETGKTRIWKWLVAMDGTWENWVAAQREIFFDNLQFHSHPFLNGIRDSEMMHGNATTTTTTKGITTTFTTTSTTITTTTTSTNLIILQSKIQQGLDLLLHDPFKGTEQNRTERETHTMSCMHHNYQHRCS